MPSEKVLGVGAWEMTTKVGLGAVCFGSAVFLPISRSESRRARLIRTLQAQHSQRTLL